MIMIRLEHIVKKFEVDRKTVLAVNDVSLHIRAREIYGIIGFSGAGKSTLVRCINLLERPDQGRVFLNGVELTSLSSSELRQSRQHIGMIFQHFNLMPSRTVFENVELPLKLSSLSKEERTQKVLKLLDLVQLSNKKDAYPSQLSGGQKQRVAIARALANDPKVLLCDEATSALDPQTTQSILSLLKDVNRQLGLTLVVITHQMSVIKSICDRVAVLESGQIVEDGTVMEVFSHPKATLTKKFIETANNMDAFYELLNIPKAIPGLDADSNVWLLTYRGKVAGESLMIELFKRFQIEANIVYGNIDILKGEILGKLGVGIKGQPNNIEKGRQYLLNRGVEVEVLK